MRALIDVHALLWYDRGDRRLPRAVGAFIDSAENDLIFSAGSALEIVIKAGTGKLDLDVPVVPYIQGLREAMSLELLTVTLEHALHVATLPRHHNDPFDRLLVAQAIVERLPIISGDASIHRYGVEVIWG